ncbi:MAG: hypothetical protein AB7S81_02890 [Bdellovibrionales bacterium]
MVETLSTLGLQTSVMTNLTSSQALLSKLTEQLTTKVYSTNLTDYSASNAQTLLDVTSTVAEQEGYLDVISTLETRLEMYDSTLTGIEDTLSTAYSALVGQQTYNEETVDSLSTQILSYMDQMTYYLNQKSGERYLYSGSRYTTAPVTNIQNLPVPPTETSPYITTGNAVPSYDADYDSLDTEKQVAAANVNCSTAIDSSTTITYGINSNEEGFQKVIMGLRWAYAATQDPDNYTEYMKTATSLISEGTSDIRSIHTAATNAYNQLDDAKSLIESKITSLQDQADNISAVDINEIGIKITLLQTQLEASYSATGTLLQLSLADYI